eukprot:3557435-Rhodomonas_salina.1
MRSVACYGKLPTMNVVQRPCVAPYAVLVQKGAWEHRLRQYKRGRRDNVCLLYTSPSPRDRG